MNAIIRRYHGYLYSTAGWVLCFFPDSLAAKDAARELIVAGFDVVRVGTRLTVNP